MVSTIPTMISSVQREADRVPGYAINGLRRFSQVQFHSEAPKCPCRILLKMYITIILQAEEWEYVCQQVKRREAIAGVVWDPRISQLPKHEQIRRDAIAYALDGGKKSKENKVDDYCTAFAFLTEQLTQPRM
jgi:hypothetical protein